jgi:hypothetical protein
MYFVAALALDVIVEWLSPIVLLVEVMVVKVVVEHG